MISPAVARFATLATVCAVLAGCAAPKTPDPRDPWEGFNRGVYKFNDGFDRVLLKPIASAYVFAAPEPVRDCIHNIFSNANDVWAAANSFLQGRGHDGINTMGRFMFNTTMGIGGCFDVASANGAAKIPNDFGITLGVWGLGQGPYLVLPIWGSSSIRDGIALPVDFYGNPLAVSQIDNVPLRNSLWGLRVIDARANLLDATDTIDRVALDPYSFIRDAYLQRRAAMVLGSGASDEANLPDYGDEQEEPVLPSVQK